VNATRDSAAFPMRPATYPEHLRRINDEVDLESRRFHHATAYTVATNTYRAASDRPKALDGLQSDVSSGSRPSGYLPALPEVVRRQVIDEAYQVRNLLSRGAIIDLMG
jgi:hypothetical protein